MTIAKTFLHIPFIYGVQWDVTRQLFLLGVLNNFLKNHFLLFMCLMVWVVVELYKIIITRS